ncbi:[protein-PII] uridylyltransferase [Falsirhodobacter halotolerans]|uniref:[protein-PII] uridylyltransferase n=1 Tax=Falsirhodobacter halotolerans TaxID=1146892 RepID=UPI001FD1FB1F|nr:[protein-PII] uridylyltransferase [Falsirhodobacter halotolerans]MCJ8138683.1 [protein-PII] uridylyltransferase [Falsirhodobacter halotolerans]
MTQPPAASLAASVSEPPDTSALRSRIAEGLPPDADPRQWRDAAIRVLSDLRREGEAELRAAFAAHPHDARALINGQSALVDRLVTTAFAVAGQSGDAHLAVIAVGGYGREEMAPFSDVDLLFLTQPRATDADRAVVEATLYILWDLKLKVGHATRSVSECLTMARSDITIRTALLEQRFITGDAALAATLPERLWTDLFRKSGPEFIEAKLAERAERHQRQGGQRYVLEPNVKEGKGGLRDLQTLYWIGKYLHRVPKAEGLVAADLFTRDEYNLFRAAEDFLWTVRSHLHYAAGRAVDKLTFDMQVEVAARMGFEDRPGRRGVERFMQEYFRQATRVGELTSVFLAELEARHAKGEARLMGLLRRRKVLKRDYRLNHGRIEPRDPSTFLSDKLNILRIFEEVQRTGTMMHPDTQRLIAANLPLIDDDMAQDREANRIFLDLMLKHGNPERILRSMNELGVLGAFIPEFGRIVAMMQFNVYHHYTVDEHTIQCISTFARIEQGEMADDVPVAPEVMRDGTFRRLMYIALLLHDIGKGRPEDHSILGAQIARRVTRRFGLTPEECDTIEWLVRYHLLMSDVAQKRDISDPRTVADFAKAVRSRKRLDLLTVLTTCDIIGVGPGTWNNWKAQLLRQLYRDTEAALEGGLETLNRQHREGEARRALRAALADWSPRGLRAEMARHYPPYWQGLPTEAQVVFARLLDGLGDDEIRIDLDVEPDRAATRACFALADHPGIFSRLAGALALAGANIVDARTYTTKDGYATAVFWIHDADGAPYDLARLPRLRQLIDRILKGEVVAREAFADRDKVKKRDSAFRFPTHIVFDNDGSDIYTIIEVDTRDRPGLLYDLTRTLAADNVYIASAQIATYGAQVVDTFYVKDMFGLKLHTRARRDSLEAKLRKAIADGAARAGR